VSTAHALSVELSNRAACQAKAAAKEKAMKEKIAKVGTEVVNVLAAPMSAFELILLAFRTREASDEQHELFGQAGQALLNKCVDMKKQATQMAMTSNTDGNVTVSLAKKVVGEMKSLSVTIKAWVVFPAWVLLSPQRCRPLCLVIAFSGVDRSCELWRCRPLMCMFIFATIKKIQAHMPTKW